MTTPVYLTSLSVLFIPNSAELPTIVVPDVVTDDTTLSSFHFLSGLDSSGEGKESLNGG